MKKKIMSQKKPTTLKMKNEREKSIKKKLKNIKKKKHQLSFIL